MEKLRDNFNFLTGASSRHNRALREVRDWAATVRKLITTYGLAEGGDLAPLLGNIGGAKFDLTGIAYTGRPMIKKAGKIIGFDFTVLIRALVENVENLRLILIRPSLQEERLEQAVSSLNRSFDNLDIAITGTGFK
ncbi:MAG: hypothetical protein A2Z05_07365 [Chloroflexi bacterium RBG_16_60_22]|nr:MAG: hypothetical protein A2Z05_07365 [Chloroflexi bacterium RBG_16_60_22]